MADSLASMAGEDDAELEIITRTHKRGPIDVLLLFATLCLVAIGLLSIYSTSSMKIWLDGGVDEMRYVKTQASGVVLGLVAMLFAMRFDYRRYAGNKNWLLLIAVIVLLILTYVPGFSSSVKGANRWLVLGPIGFQPSELAKMAAVFIMAYSLAKKGADVIKIPESILAHVVMFAPVAFFLVNQPDYGSTLIIAALVGLMLFIGGASLRVMSVSVLLLGGLAAAYLFTAEYRRDRFEAWLWPWEHRQTAGYDLVNSFVALANGGLTGKGFGEGAVQRGWIAEIHNDFIVASIGEQFGFVGIVVLVSLFVLFGWRGLSIARRAPDVYGRHLAHGITLLILLQAVINFFVVTGTIPTKGLTLPFVSFGRSSLVVLLFGVGVLLNISQQNVDLRGLRREEEEKRREELERALKIQRNKVRHRERMSKSQKMRGHV